MTNDEKREGAITLLTFWLPEDEVKRREHVAEVVGRLWDKGLKGMVGTACSLAAGLHLIDNRINCALHLGGFTKTCGKIALICSVGPVTILPGVLCLSGDCADPDTQELTPAELQSDLSIAKPAGAEPVPIRDVTTKQLQGIITGLVELVDGPAPEPPRPGWWRQLLGRKAGRGKPN